MKGKGAGFPSLVKEWLAGSLADALELPIPNFSILNVPRHLYDLGRGGLLADLGHGPVFGSKAISNVNELAATEAKEIPVEMKRRIVIFDWWIMNGDRTLSERGGNPNILWDVSSRCPFVIDHTLAFDSSVTLATLESQHVFGSELSEVIDTPLLREPWTDRFAHCLQKWDGFCESLPERWHYIDEQFTVESNFAPEGALEILRRFDTPAMWSRP